MKALGSSKITYDHNVFTKKFYDNDFSILLLYVYDMLTVGHDINEINKQKKISMDLYYQQRKFLI